jgi:hypothetical protein
VSVRRSASGSAVAWLLSCAPIALPSIWPPAEASLGEASRAALSVLPWLAWIGLPGALGSGSAKDSGSITLGTAALAAPPLAAGAAIDLGHGRSGATLAALALLSLAMILMLGFAARRAECGSRSRAFAWAWIALVPGLPILRCALELGGTPSRLATVANASPIAWAWECAGAGPFRIPWAGLAVCLGLFAIAGAPRTSET